jgi:hypothetical protein
MAQWEFNRSAALLERLGVAGQADVVNLYAARAARGFNRRRKRRRRRAEIPCRHATSNYACPHGKAQ